VIDVLVGVQDVGALLVEDPGDAGHQSLLVGAVDEKNRSVFHV